MQKTVNINLGGYPFTVNEDAYTLLNEYLTTLGKAFGSTEEGRELVEDIETRSAEILLEQTGRGSRIVTLNLVEDLIERIGRPEDFSEEITEEEIRCGDEEEVRERVQVTPPPFVAAVEAPKLPKRLFRNIDDKQIGGVCSGFAAYFGIDPTWIRLGLVALGLIIIFTDWSFISLPTLLFVYIVLWIVLPAARTPLQKMEMNGERPTLDNISMRVNQNFQRVNKEPAKKSGEFLEGLTKVLAWCTKALMVLFVGFLISGVFIALGAMLYVVFAIMTYPGRIEDYSLGAFGTVSALAFIGWCLTILVPIGMLVRAIIKPTFNLSPMPKGWLIAVWGSFVFGVVLAAVFTVTWCSMYGNAVLPALQFMNL